MSIVVSCIVLLCCFLMFKYDRPHKVALLYLAMMCLSCFSVRGLPYGNALTWLPACFFISELKNLGLILKMLRRTIVWQLILLSVISIVVLLVNSPHYNDSLKKIFIFLLLQFIPLSFCLIYGYVSFRSDNDLKPLLRSAFYGMILLTFFGVINYILKASPIINFLYEGTTLNSTTELLGNKYSDSERFRVQSLFFNPFDYGYICMATLLLYCYARLKNLVSMKKFYIVLFCCLFGIIFCGCRTVLLCSLCGGLGFMVLRYKLSTGLKYILLICCFIGILYQISPMVQDQFTKLLSIFDKDTTMESSSSIDMRITQFLSVLFYIKDNLLFGRGYGFFVIDLGWSDGLAGLVDKDLMGLEGAIMAILLERGIIGVIFYIVFYASLLLFFLRKRKVDEDMGAMGAVLIIVFLLFGNMTGELLSVAPTLLLSGMWIRLLYNKIIANERCVNNGCNSCVQSQVFKGSY